MATLSDLGGPMVASTVIDWAVSTYGPPYLYFVTDEPVKVSRSYVARLPLRAILKHADKDHFYWPKQE